MHYTMEEIKGSFKVAILALVTFSGHSGTASHFHCDTPEEWLVGISSFFPGDRWPNGIVTYELHSNLTSSDIIEVFKAFLDIQSKTCIRFVQRAGNQTAYVSIQHDDTVCGLAHYCYTRGPQVAKFGSVCTNANVMVHELGHTLCLGHEMSRKDRDEYVIIDRCGKSNEDLLGKDNFETGGHFYDYVSQMSYECGLCFTPWKMKPIMKGVTKCGSDVQNGLSALDADKINDLYNCQGCLSHRWRRTENITDAEEDELVDFRKPRNKSLRQGIYYLLRLLHGKTVEYKGAYLCRTYIGPGEIAAGQYDLEDKTCTVTFNGNVFRVTKKVQVLTVPDKTTRIRYLISDSKENMVAVGRTKDAVSIYAAYVEYEDFMGTYRQVIGKVYENDLSKAYFAINNFEVTTTKFSVIVCY